MKPFKKILGVVALSAALVAGLGVVANAESTPSEADTEVLGEVVDDDFATHPNWVPKVMKQQTVFLYKDSTAKDNALPWKLDPATSVIPIKNFAWNADIKNISTGTKQVTVSRNKTGQYYLNISTSQYIKPGKEVTVKFAIKQHGAWFNMKTKLVFAKAAVPFTQLALGGDNNILTSGAWKYIRGLRNFDLFDCYREDSLLDHPYPVKVKMMPGYKLDKIVVTKKDGHSYTIHNGNKVNLRKCKKIQIKYKATPKLTTNSRDHGVGNRVYASKAFEPKESNGYAHLFDTVYVLTINIK
jgi:hypothetical protein